jgi:hypothetical protein
MNLEDVKDISEETDDENRPPIFTGQQKKRLPLFINEEWSPDNSQPLFEDKNRDIAYWAEVEDIEKLVEFVKVKAK